MKLKTKATLIIIRKPCPPAPDKKEKRQNIDKFYIRQGQRGKKVKKILEQQNCTI